MKIKILAALMVLTSAMSSISGAQAAASREVHFYSEGVLCFGQLFLPSTHTDTSKLPAVIFAPGSGQTSASLAALASEVADRGIVTLTIDYRGWGKSGGLLYFGEPVRWDDRLRFSQTTTKMLIRRKRLEPQMQLIDIRNAITFLQGEAGVDRTRIGVWGSDLSGGHAVVLAGSDARVKAIVALAPLLEGKDLPRKAFSPTAEQQAAVIKLARNGAAPSSAQAATARNAEESNLALAEYRPFWFIDQIPQTTAVRFVLLAKGTDSKVEANTGAAVKVLKGPTDIVRITDRNQAAGSVAEWFGKNL
jgi:dienelactone hydrolase